MASPQIKGGYYLKARIIQEKKISKAPPHVREIWDYCLMNANHKDNKYNGYTIKRGQLFRTYQQIREDLCWFVGYRKMMYSMAQIKHATKILRKFLCIASTKLPGGTMITIVNYNYYQNPKNYEATNEAPHEASLGVPYNKNDKECNSNKDDFSFKKLVPIPINIFLTNKMKEYVLAQNCKHENHAAELFENFKNHHIAKGRKYKNWTSAFYTWVRNDKKFNPDNYEKKRIPVKVPKWEGNK